MKCIVVEERELVFLMSSMHVSIIEIKQNSIIPRIIRCSLSKKSSARKIKGKNITQ
jgi:hypothetical protein